MSDSENQTEDAEKKEELPLPNLLLIGYKPGVNTPPQLWMRPSDSCDYLPTTRQPFTMYSKHLPSQPYAADSLGLQLGFWGVGRGRGPGSPPALSSNTAGTPRAAVGS